MSTTKADVSIDIKGLICPYTLIQTRDTLKTMAQGQVLEVVCDYEPAAKETIPNFCQKKGYPLTTEQAGDDLWRLYIQRAD